MSDIPAKRGPKSAWKYTPEVIESLAIKLIEYVESEPLPILEEFCYKNKIQVKHPTEFAAKNEKFGKAYNEFKSCQKTKWIKKLASGDVSPSGIIFILKNITDMRDEKHILAKVEELLKFQIDPADVKTGNRLSEYINPDET